MSGFKHGALPPAKPAKRVQVPVRDRRSPQRRPLGEDRPVAPAPLAEAPPEFRFADDPRAARDRGSPGRKLFF